MALADGDDLVARYDPRRVGELAGDGSTPDPGDVPTLPVVVAAMADAEDEVIAAFRTAGRYTLEDLDAPTPPDDGGTGRSIVKRLICDLAFGLLVDRRGYAAGDEANLSPRVEQARLMLEQFRRGERVLDTDTHPPAGLPEAVTLPDAVNRADEAWRYFGIDPGRC